MVDDMEKRIKDMLLNLGADVCGIADIGRFADAPKGFHPTDVFDRCTSVVVFGRRMPKGTAVVSPRIVYNLATDLSLIELDRIAQQAALYLEDMGATAVPIPSDSPYDYWDAETQTGRGIISLRHTAVLAGLGSIGKHTLVINRTYGTMLGFGAILTDLKLRTDQMEMSLCIEACRICLDGCPVKALDGVTTKQALCRPHTYGTNTRGHNVTNCNKCRTNCPLAHGVR